MDEHAFNDPSGANRQPNHIKIAGTYVTRAQAAHTLLQRAVDALVNPAINGIPSERTIAYAAALESTAHTLLVAHETFDGNSNNSGR